MKSLKMLIATSIVICSQTSFAATRNVECRQEKTFAGEQSPTVMAKFKVGANNSGYVSSVYYHCRGSIMATNPVLKGIQSPGSNGCLILGVENRDDSTIRISLGYLPDYTNYKGQYFNFAATGKAEVRLTLGLDKEFGEGNSSANGLGSEVICEFEK